MEEKINIAEILKDAPVGTKLWSPVCGEVELKRVCIDNINCVARGYVEEVYFDEFGRDFRFSDAEDAECILFPYKNHRTWMDFKALWKHKIFEPFQKVLVATTYFGAKIWCADLYGHYDEMSHTHSLVGCSKVPDGEVIPFKGNEYKLGKPVNL